MSCNHLWRGVSDRQSQCAKCGEIYSTPDPKDARIAALERERDEALSLAHSRALTIERLTTDAERYRWLRDHALGIDTVADPDNMVQVWCETDPAKCFYGKDNDGLICGLPPAGTGDWS